MTPDRERYPRRSERTDASAWGERLAEGYRGISDRIMRELPFFNKALSVEAIGFRGHEGGIVGVMVTPRFMNVVISAPHGTAQSSTGPRSGLRLRFPCGALEFSPAEVAPVGPIASASLFSPMFGFDDMASTRAIAEAALAVLMSPVDHPASHWPNAPWLGLIDRRHFLRGELAERRT
ncbi:[NiFe]-hydrogenase assembly chaperone HybE [Bradyrhizobium yuanmingense]|uniref:[NiFe]-hydrogenase assembly chaperone HybE n=1 Tax=Bradyrhizobium yuanmingense TaxID=108015 RepID=UPI0023B8DB9A|nr:[NiFe]-hydrogenase assembly chaperone HybE [Bradyrhizobium yuanmingense]MDF0497300.1 [NiFe]-hydrogenase assembly chaperone HybE [Bradyrhizobium yuanmingense]